VLHADAGHEGAIPCTHDHGLTLPMIEGAAPPTPR
jgi:urocanate hydratase